MIDIGDDRIINRVGRLVSTHWALNVPLIKRYVSFRGPDLSLQPVQSALPTHTDQAGTQQQGGVVGDRAAALTAQRGDTLQQTTCGTTTTAGCCCVRLHCN